MPLQPAQKAAIALWLCSARYLDSECCLAEDPDGLALVVAARGTVEGAASSSELLVRSAAALPPYLVKQADCLAALPQGNAGPEAAAMLRSAEQFLRASARNVRPSETGDGPAITEEGGAPCSCGVLDLAARVETRVRRMLEAEVRLPFGVDPAITYVTALADDDRDFAPFCIDGKVSIRRSPRTVTMVLSSKPITSRDLWHVAYTLHHELVCHAFQGARATRRL